MQNPLQEFVDPEAGVMEIHDLRKFMLRLLQPRDDEYPIVERLPDILR